MNFLRSGKLKRLQLEFFTQKNGVNTNDHCELEDQRRHQPVLQVGCPEAISDLAELPPSLLHTSLPHPVLPILVMHL